MSENSGIPADKSELRVWARKRRREIDFVSASQGVVSHIAALPEFVAARNVLIYLALPDELNIEALIASNVVSPKTWYIPRCEPNRRLSIHSFDREADAFIPGPFGIREPAATSPPLSDLGTIDLVFVPGLLFTPHGYRLGNGGGYYDRFLPMLSSECARIGVIPSRQVVGALPVDPWDARVSKVVTELGIASGVTLV